jgi:copper chaperone CopZ
VKIELQDCGGSDRFVKEDLRLPPIQLEAKSMSDESERETGLDELMVARFELPEGSAVNQAEISAALRQLKGVRSITIANRAIDVTYDPLQTSEKQIEESIRGTGNTPCSAETGWEKPHPDLT